MSEKNEYPNRPTDDPQISIGTIKFFEMLTNYGKDPSLTGRLDIATFIDAHIDKVVERYRSMA